MPERELEEKDKSRPHAVPLTARGLLPVNYGALEHTRCPRDPLVAKERERGDKKKEKKRKRNKETAKRWRDRKRNVGKGNRSKHSPSSPRKAWIYISTAN